LNFGCARATLLDGLKRMSSALTAERAPTVPGQVDGK
jgi:hypothetical protein